VLVSGAGSKQSPVRSGPGLQPFSHTGRGFMVLDTSAAEFRLRIVQPVAVLRRQHLRDAEGYPLTR
jgi:hypothetical protein